MQVACVRSGNQLGGSGTGSVRTFAADATEELRKFLGALGIPNNVIAEKISSLSKIGPYEVVTVAELEIAKEVLQANGVFGL
jgi:hypothetical protein